MLIHRTASETLGPTWERISSVGFFPSAAPPSSWKAGGVIADRDQFGLLGGVNFNLGR